jgi:hypothetical protein
LKKNLLNIKKIDIIIYHIIICNNKMSNNILKFNQFRLSNFKFIETKKNGKHTKVDFKYDFESEQDLLSLKLPDEMRIPYDMSINQKVYYDKEGKSYTIDNKLLTINFDQSNEKHKNCIKIFKKFDKYILDYIKKNAHNLFKNIPDFTDITNSSFSGLLNYAKNRETKEIIPEYTGIKINVKSDTKVVNNENDELNVNENLVKSTLGSPIIRINNIWTSGTKYGINTELLCFKLNKPKTPESTFNFIDSD